MSNFISFQNGGKKGTPKWLIDLGDFLLGKKKIKPKKVLKHMSKAFKISANIASNFSSTSGYTDSLNKASNVMSSVSNAIPQSGSGSQIGGLYYGEGAGKKHNHRSIKAHGKKFANFLLGRTKVKPKFLLKVGQIVTGIVGAGATALLGPEIGAPILAGSAALGRAHKFAKTVEDSARIMTGRGKCNNCKKGKKCCQDGGKFSLTKLDRGIHKLVAEKRRRRNDIKRQEMNALYQRLGWGPYIPGQLETTIKKRIKQRGGKYKHPGGMFGKARISRRVINKKYKSCFKNFKKAGYKSVGARRECRNFINASLNEVKNYNPTLKLPTTYDPSYVHG